MTRLVGIWVGPDRGAFTALVERVSKLARWGVGLQDVYMHVVVWLANPRVRGMISVVLGVKDCSASWRAERIKAHWGRWSVGVVDVACGQAIPTGARARAGT
jgi:hypothetical protein